MQPTTIQRVLPELSATKALAHGLALCLRAGDCVLLEGELGAGKTTLLREIANVLGVDASDVASPTYVLVHVYPIPASCPVASLAAGQISHVDAYRLTSDDDLEVIGWDQLVTRKQGVLSAAGASVLCVEWPSRIAAHLPEEAHCLRVQLLHDAPSSSAAQHDETVGQARRVTLHIPHSWLERPEVQHLIDKPPTRCRTTGKWVSPLSATWPFANAQAQGADLFNWLSGSYRVSREVKADDELSD
jgi:tRNA threonylcarbamoyladenosine biosynthesis protein TsaE